MREPTQRTSSKSPSPYVGRWRVILIYKTWSPTISTDLVLRGRRGAKANRFESSSPDWSWRVLRSTRHPLRRECSGVSSEKEGCVHLQRTGGTITVRGTLQLGFEGCVRLHQNGEGDSRSKKWLKYNQSPKWRESEAHQGVWTSLFLKDSHRNVSPRPGRIWTRALLEVMLGDLPSGAQSLWVSRDGQQTSASEISPHEVPPARSEEEVSAQQRRKLWSSRGSFANNHRGCLH